MVCARIKSESSRVDGQFRTWFDIRRVFRCQALAMFFYRAVFMLVVVACGSSRTVVAESAAKCECAVFKHPTSQTTKENPLASKAPQFNFACDADGKESCSNMCKALAGASREEGPKRICELVKDANVPFKPMIYYRACNDEAWTYTGLKPTIEVCCKAKTVVPCA